MKFLNNCGKNSFPGLLKYLKNNAISTTLTGNSNCWSDEASSLQGQVYVESQQVSGYSKSNLKSCEREDKTLKVASSLVMESAKSSLKLFLHLKQVPKSVNSFDTSPSQVTSHLRSVQILINLGIPISNLRSCMLKSIKLSLRKTYVKTQSFSLDYVKSNIGSFVESLILWSQDSAIQDKVRSHSI